MRRILFSLAVGLLLASGSPALAQRGPMGPGPGNRGNSDEMKKILEEIEKLQADIKEAEAQIRNAQNRKDDSRPASPRSGEAPAGQKGGPFAPGSGRPSGPGGFGGGGFGPGAGGGPPFGGFGSRGGNDVKSLQTQLDQLKEAAKQIEERTKDVEARLKKAKEEEARNAAKPSTPMGKGGPKSNDQRSSGDVDKRLDRIEQVLEEIQKELRRKK